VGQISREYVVCYQYTVCFLNAYNYYLKCLDCHNFVTPMVVYAYAHIHIYLSISIAYAHPPASVKQMCTLMFTTPVWRTHLHMHGAQQHLWMHADSLQKWIWIRIYTYTYTYIHVHIHTHTCTHIYIYTYAYTYTYIYTWIHIHIHTHIYVHIHIYICIYAYAHIYIYLSISIAYAHPVSSVKQMCTLTFTSSV